MPPRRRLLPIQELKPWLAQGLRVALFVGILVLIHFQHAKLTLQTQTDNTLGPSLADVQTVLPSASNLDSVTPSGQRIIRDIEGEILGYAMMTSPKSDHIVGFSGPTNLLLVFGPEDRLMDLTILQSGDTQEHVQIIAEDSEFRATYRGQSRANIAEGGVDVDAVSGATLTSVAISQSIVHRLGGTLQPSAIFPDAVELAGIRGLFPTADAFAAAESTPSFMSVRDDSGQLLGEVMRSSPVGDEIRGYQGPTDVLIGFDTDGKCVGVRIRRSYDNEPYVGYVREDDYFAKSFRGKTLEELATENPLEQGVEGVSGATMTSLAVADVVYLAAKNAFEERQRPPATAKPCWSPKPRDIGTILVVLGGIVFAFTPLKGYKPLRIAFQLVLVGYLGLINGDLLSQASLIGWAQHGVPWKSALGLVVLTIAALILPVISRRNVYCHQICPHGALQQLVKNRLPWKLPLNRFWQNSLAAIPALLLVAVIVISMLALPFGLVNLEPFDAYLFRIAGWGTIGVFLVGMLASLSVPMAYCRFGCPTGAVLSFLRRHRLSSQWGFRDGVAVALLLLALILFAAK